MPRPTLVRLAAKPSDGWCAKGNDNGKHADCIPFIGLPSPPNSLAHVDPLSTEVEGNEDRVETRDEGVRLADGDPYRCGLVERGADFGARGLRFEIKVGCGSVVLAVHVRFP